MAEAPPSDILAALRRMGLLGPGIPALGERLTGGVSSDIWRIDLPSGPVCIKRALAKLRVAADWQAPVERNRYEARWMQRANAAAPGAAPRLLGVDEASGALAMQFLPPDRYALWKTQLRDGDADPGFAARGRHEAGPHSRCDRRRRHGRGGIPDRPHLLRHPPGTLSGRDWPGASRPRPPPQRLGHDHPGQQARPGARRRQPEEHPARPGWPGVPGRRVRLVGRSGVRPGFLPQSPAAEMPVDAERHRPASLPASTHSRRPICRRGRLGTAVDLEARAAGLLPGLFLARVDGKSPVEYITAEPDKDRVRRTARALLAHPVGALGEVRQAWTKELAA